MIFSNKMFTFFKNHIRINKHKNSNVFSDELEIKIDKVHIMGENLKRKRKEIRERFNIHE